MSNKTTTKVIAPYPHYTLGFSFGDLRDAAKAVAVKYGESKFSYFDSLKKSEVQAIYDLSMANLMSYPIDTIGSRDACEILGFLEDTYREWVDEFEAN